MKPIVVVNFKTYKQGEKVVELAKLMERVDRKVVVGVQASDVYEVSRAVGLRVYVQHVDCQEKGRNTGFVLPEAVKKDGAVGSFLNHSEHELRFDVLKKSVKRCKEVGLKTIVFASGLKEALKIESLGVDYLVVEPPELVGGNVSVSKARPELIESITKKLKGRFLVGAGIKTREDVETALKLGASGIAVSSGVVKAKEPAKILRGLVGS